MRISPAATVGHPLLHLLAGLALVSACATQGAGGGSEGGSGGSGLGGTSASGSGGSASGGHLGTGGAGTGGSSASAGTTGSPGTAGSAAGGTLGAGAAGGKSGSGGSGGNGGTPAGGAVGSGGTGGRGGTGAGGNTSGSGGTGAGGTTGASGASGHGGTSGGTAGTTGSTGTGGSTGGGGGNATSHWVGTWAASPYYDSANQPPTSLSNAVIRQITHVSIGGSQLRVQFSNLFGNGSVSIKSAHVAICGTTTSLVDSTINTTTDTALAFSGTASVTIAQGQEVWSDAVSFTVPSLGNVTITTAFGTVPSNVTGHSGSRTNSFIQAGSSTVNAASMSSATSTEHWYIISGIDVMAPASDKAAVAIGDSITDGRGVDINKNDRWTDDLSARLQAMGATSNVGMLNQGIGATNLVGTGTAAQARYSRDVLGQDGARYAIIYDGVNDILGGASFSSMQTVYAGLISQGHTKGLLVYAATITPFGAYSGYTAAHESVRQQVNTYIKSGAFDGVLDFDAAVTDGGVGGNPPQLQSQYATWTSADGMGDGLHPSPAGYQKMADSVDLTLFTK